MLAIAFTWLAARGGYEALIWHPCGSGPPDRLEHAVAHFQQYDINWRVALYSTCSKLSDSTSTVRGKWSVIYRMMPPDFISPIGARHSFLYVIPAGVVQGKLLFKLQH